MQAGGLGTLLVDLLEEPEANDRSKVFDIELLAERLQDAADWLTNQPEAKGLHVGYFGASTGAGAALLAAARAPEAVGAVVSRGGRPDLAGEALRLVTAPTLLIVGGDDEVVLELNREAFETTHLLPPARYYPRRHSLVPRARRPRRGRTHGPGVVPALLDAIAHLTTGAKPHPPRGQVGVAHHKGPKGLVRVGRDDLTRGASDQSLPDLEADGVLDEPNRAVGEPGIEAARVG